jgi:hypothetical protein
MLPGIETEPSVRGQENFSAECAAATGSITASAVAKSGERFMADTNILDWGAVANIRRPARCIGQ